MRHRGPGRSDPRLPRCRGYSLGRQLAARARARLNDNLDPRVVVGEHGWWQACAELGAPGYDPFGPDGATVIDVFSPVRSDWNDTTRLAITEGRWP